MMTVQPYSHGPGTPLVDPASIPDLSAWWNPDDSGTVTLVGGTGPEVATLADKAGSADLTKNGSNLALSTTTSGGRTWLNTPGHLHVASPTQAEVNFGSGELTILAVASWSSTTSNLAVLNKGSTDRYRLGVNFPSAGGVYSILDDGPTSYNLNVAGSYNSGTPHLLVMQRDNTAGEFRFYVDGVQITGSPQALSGFGDIDDASFELLVGATPSGGSFANLFQGLIGEILMYKRALDSSELADLKTYFHSRWGSP